MNLLDFGVIAVILFFGFLAYKKGFLKACFSSLPMILALAAVHFIQPIVSKMVRGTEFYVSFREKLVQSLGLENLISDTVMQSQTELIQSMPLPDFLKSALVENNNPVVYQILDVSKIQDYIGGYLANICINILTMAVVFFVTLILAKIALATLNLFAQLPVLSTVNKVAGLAVGILQGTLIIWIAGIFLTFFYSNPNFQGVVSLLKQSVLASRLYENNLLLVFILNIFT